MVAQVTSEKLLAPAVDARYRIGAWVIVAGIAMLFTGLSSAYIVRAAAAPDWRPLQMPPVLWLSTTLIIMSSVAMEAARRNLRSVIADSYRGWLFLSVLLGVGFLASQLFAWRQLVHQGIYLASNPHSSFFYLLTATHGLHLLGGLLALAYLLLRDARRRDAETSALKRVALVEATAIYWHFMDALWIYLFVLLFVWRSM
jgi:cytochrome c oxidase subunit III